MLTKVMVATPIRSFGELISQALQEIDYFPLFVAGSAEVMNIARTEEFKIAVLDCKMPEPGAAKLAEDLHTLIDGLHIIFVHLDEGCDQGMSLIPELDIELVRPFYLPDLLEAVVELSAGTSADAFTPISEKTTPSDVSEIPEELIWLQDVNQAAQYLTRLSLEADAQAALIIRRNQIWACAGQLSQAAIEELAQLVKQHWTHGGGGDLVRFVRLASTNREYMLYATGLGSGFVLALAFESEMPFSKIRAQTGEIARRLTSPPEEPLPEAEIKPVRKKEPPPLDIDDFSPEDWIPEDDFSEDDPEMYIEDEALIERQAAMFEDLLATIDIPDPDGARQSPAIKQTEVALDRQVDTGSPEAEITPAVLPEAPSYFKLKPIQRSAPLPSTEIRLDPETASFHDLAYACVLLPRLPTHHLTGELPELLNHEIERLCLAFGWQLEHLDLRPQYLHWVVRVEPDVAAAQVIHEIRQRTSTQIFETFPRLAKENPSGDFWAPGFMVVHGRDPLTGVKVQDFVQQTRIRQGLDKF